MKIIAIKNPEIKKFADKLTSFYSSLYNVKSDYYKKAIENSGIICLAEENEKIVGACRILTDFTKHAHIVDLIVQPEYREKGLGKELITLAARECNKLGCKYIGLTCSPELIGFYGKVGFGPEEGFQYMKYKKPRNAGEY